MALSHPGLLAAEKPQAEISAFKDRPWRDSVEPDPANLSDALTAEAEEAGSWVVKL